MWFDNVVGKEKIQFMFNNELNMEHIELSSFLFHENSSLRINFYSRNIPQKYPTKWDNDGGFNALSIVLSFHNVEVFESKCRRVGFFCTPCIQVSEKVSLIKINHDDFYLYCSAQLSIIEGITPYIDERWD